MVEIADGFCVRSSMLDFIRSVRTARKNETTDRCRSMKQHRDYLSELNAFQTATKSDIPPGAVNKIFEFSSGALCLLMVRCKFAD